MADSDRDHRDNARIAVRKCWAILANAARGLVTIGRVLHCAENTRPDARDKSDCPPLSSPSPSRRGEDSGAKEGGRRNRRRGVLSSLRRPEAPPPMIVGSMVPRVSWLKDVGLLSQTPL